MKFIYFRDKKKRSLFKKFEVKRLFVSSLLKSTFILFSIRVSLFNKSVFIYPKYSCKSSFKNRCLVTNSSKSVRIVSGLVLSRQSLFKVFSFGGLFPFFRSGW